MLVAELNALFRVSLPDMVYSRRAFFLALLLAIAACHPDFQVTKFPTHEALYRAAMTEYAAGRWDNAVEALEKLTVDLPARDTLLPRAHWYLAKTHQQRGEHVLAAGSFSRLVESFPDDSLSDDAALAAAREYRVMWRKPTLDPEYGVTALATYNTLLGLYPTSPLIPDAQKEIAALEEMFAQKEYLTGLFYFRRGGYDPAMIYFNSVVAKYPNAPTARLAQLRLVDSFNAIKYKPEAVETCASLRLRFPKDAEVATACSGVASPVDSLKTPPATTGPPALPKPAKPAKPATPATP